MNKNTDIYKITKFDNQINQVQFKKLNPIEMDLLFRMFNDLCGKGQEPKIYSFMEMRENLQIGSKLSDKEMIKYLKSLSKKFLSMPCEITTDHIITIFVPFHKFEINEESKTFKAALHEDFQPLLNDLFKEYTSFRIDDFLSLKGKYAKHLFRVLKQYRTTGYVELTIEEIRQYLDIPESMPNRNIGTKVIDVAFKELTHYFRNLKCTPIKGRGYGRPPLTGYKFTFEPEPSYVESTYDGQMTIDDFE